MKQPLLSIQNLSVSIGDKQIIKNLSIDIFPGEIHAIMGPNGTGKSTLAKVLSGHPQAIVDAGDILFQGRSILSMLPEERAGLGLFLGFQYPVEIKGLSNTLFLQEAINAQRKTKNIPPISNEDFTRLLDEKMALLGIKHAFKERDVNEGFSGGEKKKNEILQMAVLNPAFSILDEIDSGLDIDALKSVSTGLQAILQEDPQKSVLLITHYPRMLDYITPNKVHIMMGGTLIKSGDLSLAKKLELVGYEELISNEP